jgi:putative peptidoglycan lipid II flippase
LRVVAASALLGALLVWAAQAVPWVALRSHDGQRIGLLAASLAGAAVVYFGTLLLTGLNFRQFMRRG